MNNAVFNHFFGCPIIVLNVYKISFGRKTSALYLRGTNLDSSVSIDWVNTKPPPSYRSG